MPIYEYLFENGERVERIHTYPPPQEIEEAGETGILVPSAAAVKIEDGTERFFKATGQRVVEPGVKEDVKRARQYREEREAKERRKELEKVFPEVLAETGVQLAD